MPTSPQVARPRAAHRAIVSRVEHYVRRRLDAPLTVCRLSQIAGVSERSLRNAFYAVHGSGPKRWVQAERLRRVARALRAADAAEITVTGIMAAHGVYEFGRFAGIYKQAFAETPFQTLRRCRPECGPRPSVTEGTSHAAGP
jgi:AraC family ethanolamine operon transcriptional activator